MTNNIGNTVGYSFGAIIILGIVSIWVYFDNNALEKDFEQLVEQVDADIRAVQKKGKTPNVEGTVGPNKHPFYMYVYVPSRGRKETRMIITCPDIKPDIEFALALRERRVFEVSSAPEIKTGDEKFDEVFEVYANSVAFANEILTNKIKQMLLKNKAFIDGKFYLNDSELCYETYGEFNDDDIPAFKQIIRIGSELIEQLHTTVNTTMPSLKNNAQNK